MKGKPVKMAKNLMTQFTYNHKRVDAQVMKIKKSMEEAGRMLEQMGNQNEK